MVNNKVVTLKWINFTSSFISSIPLSLVFFCFLLMSNNNPTLSSSVHVPWFPVLYPGAYMKGMLLIHLAQPDSACNP